MAKQTQDFPRIYPIDRWTIRETAWNSAYQARNESVFALGNGFIGTRGTFEEDFLNSVEGTYLNGFYESETIRYPEIAYGYAEKSQTMLNITQAKGLRVYLEDELFDIRTGTVLEYERKLDMQAGSLYWMARWRSPQGREILLDTLRLVSLANPNLLVVGRRILPQNFSGTIRLVSVLDGKVENLVTVDDPRVGGGLHGQVLSMEQITADGTFGGIVQRTEHSKLALACAVEHELYIPHDPETKITPTGVEFSWNLPTTETIALTKYIVYTSTQHTPEHELLMQAQQIVQAAKKASLTHWGTKQQDVLADFWNVADIEIEGDEALQQGIRFNLFHLFQSVGRDGKTNIGAKGLTGEGYEGHYFWDTEIYMLPFFLYTQPKIARKLLEYRYSILDAARNRARQMSHPRGALYAWRTINGDECSAYYPAGTAQYHINAAVAYAIQRYMDATLDTEFLQQYGAEMLFETARLWADLGVYIADKGFCINGVTGPDEYTAVVNNNAYTNLMARENLRYAAQVARELPAEVYATLAVKIDLLPAEVEAWQAAADAMYIPRDEQRGIIPQDDTFLHKAPWDFAHTPAEKYPLLLHFHPLVIYRHQVCKQADLVLALLLLGNSFSLDEKRRNYDFYEPLTTHDSSLSTCIFSIIANEIGYSDKAYDYFIHSARMDLEDTHRNVKNGVHTANMAGTWLGMVQGFGGVRFYGGKIHLAPTLPAQWTRYRFSLTFRGCILRVTVDKQGVVLELTQGETLTVEYRGREVTVKAGEGSLLVW